MNTLNHFTTGRRRGLRVRLLTETQRQNLEKERRAFELRRAAECMTDAMIAGFFPSGGADSYLFRDMPRHENSEE